MKGEQRFRWIIRAVSHYFTFFLLVAFVITCCMMLFVTSLSDSLGIALTNDNLGTSAKLTFWNVILISFIFTVVDAIRRKWTVDRPVKHISEATAKMMQGDFNVRVSPVSKFVADDKFNEIIACINQMAEELSGVETLRTDFIANVSHEMKTPLAVMQNYGTLLQAPDLPDDKRVEYAKAVTDASRRLADMMTNILKLNRLENQQIYPKAEIYDLGEQLCECLLQYENVWESRSIEIVTDIEENVRINADSELLSLVWNNLFSNAFKFTESGGTVSLSLSADETYATVKVKDTGCGMSPEVGAHIFEKFYQGDTSHATQGNGLGLALVKRVVDITQGEIGVESVQGVGSTFTVKIRRTEHEHLEENR
ncbi:MAG: HAMP domain-containing histidine kinase [Clostridia bacterium]|nr:HAMP domain-containing histidine kinase [Clostridia bacterium]